MRPAAVQRLRTPIGLAGCGVEGLGTLAYLRAHGVGQLPGDMRLFDRTLAERRDRGEALPPEVAGFPLFGAEQWERELPRCGTVFRSPGVRPDHPALAAARAAGAAIVSATGWFLDHCPAPVVGVTGTVGKGTAATLIHQALTASGIPSRLAGNIGLNPLAFLDEVRPEQPVVLELSSFQLIDLGPVRPCIAVVLRTSEDHLDWHPDVAEYLRAKSRLLAPDGRLPDGRRQTVIYCTDAPGSRRVVELARGAGAVDGGAPGVLAVSRAGPVREGIGVRNGQVLRFRADGSGASGAGATDAGAAGGGSAVPGSVGPGPAGAGSAEFERLAPLERLALPGPFNLENAAAAFLAAEALGADRERALAALAAFPGLPHRLERAGAVRGVACFNDSYATRPDATVAALDAFAGPLALILGGSEKHAGFRELAEALCRHAGLRRVLLIGATAERLEREIAAAAARLGTRAPPCARCPGLREAFEAGLAALEGAAGGVLLLSPACASFGLFPNYKVRGERFKALVEDAAGRAAPAR